MVGREQERVSERNLEKRRAQVRFYARLRGWIVTALLLIGAVSIIFYYVQRWTRPSEKGESRMVAPNEVFGDRSAGLVFDYARMINLMQEYSKLVVEEEAGAPWGSRPIERFRNLLDRLQTEKRAYSDYMESIRRSQSYTPTKRRQRATLHYMRSMDDAISDLQRILRDRGAIPMPSDLTSTGR